MLSFIKMLTIRSRLYFIVGIMAFLIVLELLLLGFTIDALSSVRAFVGGEGLWSKAQKDAAYAIGQYASKHKETDYAAFLNFLKVPLGDSKARVELEKPDYNYNAVHQGFVEGRNNVSDIPGMARLIHRFRRIYYIDKAVGYWTEGDTMIAKILVNADMLHRTINEHSNDAAAIEAISNNITAINAQITVLEDNFSYILGEGSRWLEGLVLKILVLTAITVELTGLLMSIALSKGITKGIRLITNASDEVMKGNYSARAIVASHDELGQLAAQFNAMTITLEHKIQELKNEELRRERLLQDLKEINRELKNFAYVVSHDLKSPLRGIITVASWLKKDYAAQLDDQGKDYLDLIERRIIRMNDLIDGILQYSRASSNKTEKSWIDTAALIKDLMELLAPPSHICITVDGQLPVVYYERIKLAQVFQNLMSNAIKYIDKPVGEIVIACKEAPTHWEFSVRDNGPGIEEKYFEKIFQIFQTLTDKETADSTGIGLSIVQKIIENNGGKVYLQSKLSKGTTFYFTLPKHTA